MTKTESARAFYREPGTVGAWQIAAEIPIPSELESPTRSLVGILVLLRKSIGLVRARRVVWLAIQFEWYRGYCFYSSQRVFFEAFFLFIGKL